MVFCSGDKRIGQSKAAVHSLKIQDSRRDSRYYTKNTNSWQLRLTVNFFVLPCIALSESGTAFNSPKKEKILLVPDVLSV